MKESTLLSNMTSEDTQNIDIIEHASSPSPKHAPTESPARFRQRTVFNFDDLGLFDTNMPPRGNLRNPVWTGKQLLRVPKTDARGRLTSTPNTADINDTPSSKDIMKGDLEDLSPCVNSYHHSSKAQSYLEKNIAVDDLKSVLFPSKTSHKRTVEREFNRDGNNGGNDSICGPRNLEASLQDSGFDSLATSTTSQDSYSVFTSPMKRKAGDCVTSVESPMKRLAFDSLRCQNDSEKQTLSFDSCTPGNSFFLDRDYEQDDILDTPPTPIFANAIQFSQSPSLALSTDSFQFTRPTLAPPKQSAKARSKSRCTDLNSKHICQAGQLHFDIITHLARQDLTHVITKIFSTVRPKDILRCSRVSVSWAQVCERNRYLREKIKSLKQQYQDDERLYGSENVKASDAIEKALLKSPAKFRPHRDLSNGTCALGALQARAKRTPTKSQNCMPKTPSGKNYFVPATDKFQHNQGVKRTLQFGESMRPCPKCGWTAKMYGDGANKGLCYRYKCRYEFCTCCKSAYHHPKPCSPTKDSPPHDERVKAPKIGTKKSRERLKKRLLM